jgi:type 1 glutamine amidotransferase
VLADRHERTGITEPAWKEHAEMVGGGWPQAPSKQFHGARHSFRVRVVDSAHPVTKGLGDAFVATDELYHQMTVLPSAHVLATAWSDPATGGTGKDEPILWVNTFGRGRAYFTALGHEVAAMQNEGFRPPFCRATGAPRP